MAALDIKDGGAYLSTWCTGRRPLTAHNDEDFRIRRGTSYKYAFTMSFHDVDENGGLKDTPLITYNEGRFTFPVSSDSTIDEDAGDVDEAED